MQLYSSLSSYSLSLFFTKKKRESFLLFRSWLHMSVLLLLSDRRGPSVGHTVSWQHLCVVVSSRSRQIIHRHVNLPVFERRRQRVEHELWPHCHWCRQTCHGLRLSWDGRLSVSYPKGVPRAVVAPVTEPATAVVVVAVAVVGWAARDGRLYEGRPAFGAQLPVFLYEHMDRQHAHHLSQHEGQSSKIKRPAVGVALLVVALAGVTWVGWYVHDDANDVTETWKSLEGKRRSAVEDSFISFLKKYWSS